MGERKGRGCRRRRRRRCGITLRRVQAGRMMIERRRNEKWGGVEIVIGCAGTRTGGGGMMM